MSETNYESIRDAIVAARNSLEMAHCDWECGHNPKVIALGGGCDVAETDKGVVSHLRDARNIIVGLLERMEKHED